jgi:hypothetical protein
MERSGVIITLRRFPSPSPILTNRRRGEGGFAERRKHKCWRNRYQSDAETHVDILSQELVRRLVLLQGIVVDGGAGQGAAEEETEEPKRAYCQTQIALVKALGTQLSGTRYPPRKAPTGLRAESGAAATASRRRADVWKLRAYRRAGAALVRVRAPVDSILEAISIGVLCECFTVDGEYCRMMMSICQMAGTPRP